MQALEVLTGGGVLTTALVTLPGYTTPQRIAIPAAGALATITDHTTTAAVSVRPNADGTGVPLTQPLTLDSDGRLPGYVDAANLLDVSISGAGVIPRTFSIGGASSGGTNTAVDVTQAPYRCVGDGGTASDGAISSTVTPTRLTTAAAASMKVGMKVFVKGAGAAGGMLSTTVSALVDATHVTLAAAASTTVASAGAIVYGTDNSAGILAAVATGRPLYFPVPTGAFYYFDVGAFGGALNANTVQPPTSGYLKLIGDHRMTTTIRFGPEGATTNVIFANVSAGQITTQDLTIQGPDTLGAGGRAMGVQVGVAGLARFVSARVRRCSDCTLVNAASSVGGIDADFTIFEGYGTVNPTICVGAYDGGAGAYNPTKRVRLNRCEFFNFGDPAGGNLYHAIYVDASFDLDVDQGTFRTPAGTSTGNVIQHYDTVTTAARAAPMSAIRNSYFARDLGNMTGILTNYQGLTKIVGCTFDQPLGTAVGVNGPTIVDDCLFISSTAGNGVGLVRTVAQDAAGLPWSLQMTNSVFTMNATSAYAFELSHSAAASNFHIYANTFQGAASNVPSYIIIFGAAVVGGELAITDNDFTGLPNRLFWAASDTTHPTFSFCRNRVLIGNSTVFRFDVGVSNPNILDNEFSQGSGAAGVFSGANAPSPSANIARNAGLFPYKTENAGASTQTPGAVSTVTIAHGLGATGRIVIPTRMTVQPGDANARGAPAFYLTATASNIVLTFASVLTAATAYTWNWQAAA